ncbi:MAG: TorF family putative porin [Chrysiogenia bacterium]
MKKSVLLLLVCLVGAMLPLPGAVSAQVDLVSRYIWRGFDLLPDGHAAIQPSLTVDLGKSGFSLNVWSSFALAQRGVFKYSDEIDLTLEYAFKMPEGWELSAGVIHYGYWFAEDFKFKDHTSQEVYATVTSTDLPLSPELCVYYDLNLGSGLYVTLGGSQEWKASEKVNVEVGGVIGFNSRQYIDKTGFSDIGIYARLALTAGKLTLIPSLNVMIPLLDEVNEDTEIWFGFSAAL